MLTPRKMALITVPMLVIAGAVALFGLRHSDRWPVTADFADTTGVYVGNEVQYLGVPVGEITSITPMGPVMRVHMEVDKDIRIPQDAAAQIMQSALLTDRYVELGPVYKGGPSLPPGANIGDDHTRSPVSFDDLGKSIDQLVVALDRKGPDGKGIEDVLAVTADNLDGNGERIRRLIVSSRDALASINAKEPDLTAVTKNLNVLVEVLSERDTTVRRFTKNLQDASKVVAGQTDDLDKTLRSLVKLTHEVSDFVDENRTELRANLRDVATVTKTIRSQQAQLARIFDYLPMGSENIARAYNPDVRAIGVQLAVRDMAVFSQSVRQAFCTAIGGSACVFLTNPDGTGLFDIIFDTLENAFPGNF
jgi:phospholipid/cholesterol/gamma-HCH transport system substrate-binding protein